MKKENVQKKEGTAMGSTNPETVKKSGRKISCHAGHRDRTKKKLLKEGFSQLYDHELLEILLFYCIPRRDTNLLAHELIEEFGSLNGLMEADVDRIATHPGMGESSALLIKTVMEMSVRYIKGSEEPIQYYDSLAKVMQYLRGNLYVGQTKEVVYALLFDGKMKLLDALKIGEGGIGMTEVQLTLLVSAVIKRGAKAVILSHNHPNGTPAPSGEDMAVTWQIYEFLRNLSVPLLEHVIVTNTGAFPIMHCSAQYNVESLCNSSFGDEFFHKFFSA